jgi:hypothetical protein
MKRFILAALVLVSAVVAGCQPAAAQVPITTEHTGHFHDPRQSGQGVELHVLANGQVFGTLFLGSVPGWYWTPIWLSAQGRVDNTATPQTFPLYQSVGVIFGEARPLGLAVVGQVTLTALSESCGIDVCLTADITIDGREFVAFSPAPSPITHTLRLRRLL